MSYRVSLDIFDGPLDLLLYLIKKEDLDISKVSVSTVASQYFEYINLMQVLDLNFAGEYLVTAAALIHMKSDSLLPREESVLEEEETIDLVKQLIEYRKFKEAASILQERENERLNVFTRPDAGKVVDDEVLLDVSLFDLLGAFNEVLNRLDPEEIIREIACEEYTVKEKIRVIQDILRLDPVVNFTKIFEKARARVEAVATFLAILELIKMKEVRVKQTGEFGEIYIYRTGHDQEQTLE